MTNNSGDMTNKIGDEDRSTNEEIERMIHDVRKIEVFVEPDRDAKLAYALEELLRLRSLNKRLVEDGGLLSMAIFGLCGGKPDGKMKELLDQHAALMKEIGG